MAKIPYEVTGDSNQAIMFIHGFLDAGKVWKRVIEKLDAPNFSFITLDLPGMGGASGWSGGLDLRTMADAVVSVLDETGKRVILVGHSMGAQIAELVAASRPEKVLGMAFLAPIPLEGLPVDPQTTEVMHIVGGNEEIQRMLRKQFSPELPEERIEELVVTGMVVKPEAAAKIFDVWSAGEPVGREPCGVDVPVAIFAGEHDPFAPPAMVDSAMKPRFKSCAVHTLAGASHWPHASDPAFIAEQLGSFFRQF